MARPTARPTDLNLTELCYPYMMRVVADIFPLIPYC